MPAAGQPRSTLPIKGKLKDPSTIFEVYELAKSGMGVQRIAEILGVNIKSFKVWKRRDPMVANAIKAGRDAAIRAADGEGFLDFVYKRMGKENRQIWEEIMAIDQKGASKAESRAKIEALFKGKSVRIRQNLFLHAVEIGRAHV